MPAPCAAGCASTTASCAAAAAAGSFVHLTCDDALPMRRPMSIMRVGEDWIEVLYKVVGQGLRLLSHKTPGAAIKDLKMFRLSWVVLGILLIGVYELQSRIDIPYRVVINEGVNLARRFGAVDGHKYINACLDLAAQSLREIEVSAKAGG